MKKIVLTILIVLTANSVDAQKLIVYSLKGKVEEITANTTRSVKLRDVFTPNTILNIPYHGCVILYDEQGSHQFTLKTPGRATVKDMIIDNRNNIKTLTADYIAFIKKQITGGGQVWLRNCSDPATVTRNLMITLSEENSDLLLCGNDGFSDNLESSHNKTDNPFKKDFQTWRKEMLNNYQSFRKKVLQDYADFVRDPWSQMKLSPAEEKPKDEKIKPIIIDKDDGKVSPPPKENVKEEKETIISVLPLPQPLPAPDPVTPIKEDHSQNKQYRSFMFYGTKMKVRWSDDCAFHLKDINEHSIADAITVLSDKKYDNVLYDCLQLRSACHLSDWAYYLMLKELSASFCGKDTNEAALFLAMLFSQSGYRLRLAKSGQKLLLLISTQFNLYGYSYLEMDGHNYYLLDGNFESVDVCKAQFPKEQEMSLIMKESPRLADNKSEVRKISSSVRPQLTAQVSVNKNLIDFYATYPSSYFNNDFMTRWAMYANKEMQPEVREQLYPQLKAIIKDKSQHDGVENLLNWIQTAFKYEYDDKVWGCDRTFFAEESLFYPSCDCEDRSILFTRLVRDLLGLKCILVYYPGHLATGVCFTENVKGDSIVVNGNCYTICDPTLIGAGAPVGTTMSGMDNTSASVIVLE